MTSDRRAHQRSLTVLNSLSSDLVAGIEKRTGLAIPSSRRAELVSSLSHAVTPKNAEFSKRVPYGDTTRVTDRATGNYHDLEFGAIINGNPQALIKPDTFEWFCSYARSVFKGADIERMTDLLRDSPQVLELLANADSEYSLLLRHQMYDVTKDEGLYVITKPLLIVPGHEDNSAVRTFEEQNTKHEFERLFSRRKRVSRNDYFSAA
jgi:hypothetical protein